MGVRMRGDLQPQTCIYLQFSVCTIFRHSLSFMSWLIPLEHFTHNLTVTNQNPVGNLQHLTKMMSYC